MQYYLGYHRRGIYASRGNIITKKMIKLTFVNSTKSQKKRYKNNLYTVSQMY